MRRRATFALAFLLFACGVEDPARVEWSATCREVTCGERVYSMDVYAGEHRCRWKCAHYGGEWKQVLLRFESDGECWATRVETSRCWSEE